MSRANSHKEAITRRDALKTLAAITGAATLAGLPSRWETPVIDVGALPAHACVSATPPFAAPGEITASATWSPAIEYGQQEGILFLDIAVGDCQQGVDFLDTDDTNSGTGPLNVSLGGLAPGTYLVDMENAGDTALQASVTVTTEFGTATFNGAIPPFSFVIITRITLPGGSCGGVTFEICSEEGGPEGAGRRKSR